MADDVPVADVLCEAMEYLAKLGSNLRARSDILKEKKIRKDKLKNAHAVLKAAQKVLTICDLSRKSLDNVETGVKKIMAVVDAAQASTGDGGKSVKRDKLNTTRTKTLSSSNKDSSTFIMFPWGKQVLKIKKKINLKHYQSVKVIARSMPKSMIEKYPVYYNCRLYRIRKRMAIKEANSTRHSVDSNASSSLDHKKSEENGNMSSAQYGFLQSDTECKDADNNSNEDDKQSSVTEKDTESKIKHKKKQVTCEALDQDSSTSTSLKQKDAEKESRIKSSPINIDSSEDETPKRHKKQKTKKVKRVRIIDDSSESEKEDNAKTAEPGDIKIVSLEIEDDDLEITKISTEISSRHNQDKPSDELVNNISDDECLQNKSEREMSSHEISENKKDDSCDENSKDKTEKSNVKDDLNTAPVKPLIKCVSITKLLKPDVLQKETRDLKSKNIVVLMNQKGELKSKPLEKLQESTKKVYSNKAKLKLDPVKQQMVKAFKPKKFSINVMKLPPLTSDFLLENKLKRITQNGLVLCEVQSNTASCLQTQPEKNFEKEIGKENSNNAKNALKKCSDKEKLEKSHSTSKLSSANDINEKEGVNDAELTNNAKNALLNDSDTEKSETSRLPSSSDINENEGVNVTKSTNDAKNALLNDSDTEKSETSPITSRLPSSSDINENEGLNDAKSTNDAKNALLNDSDSEKSETSPITSRLPSSSDINEKEGSNDAVTTNNAKSALLNDSDTERSEISPIKSRLPDSSDNNETEKIKKALLNDSDSDNSEEENHQPKHPSPKPGTKTLMEKESKSQENSSSEIDATETQQVESNSLNIEAAKNKITSEKDTNEEEELAKSSLLHDSSGSSSKSPEKRRKKDVTSRRKHIMESMHAKKMLLTYSSSSDTEDERLKNVSESSKKKHSSSGSDENNLLKHKKKKRKVSRSPSAEVQTEDRSDHSESGVDSSSKSKPKSKTKMGRSKEKPGCSNSQNSVAQEDKDIEGLTNLKSLTKRRRRESVSGNSDKPESTSTRSSSRSVKKEAMATKHITGEQGLVEAHSSSDEASEASDGPEEDLPPISLSTGLNGGALDHLAKDDLLEESESDSSKDNNTEAKKETDSDSDNLKSKRRKANTISSDSEGGSSRRKEKDKDVRISDFEDSEDDNSEPIKRSKRKKKGSDSDASGGSSAEEGKKKRRRIKQIDSDGSGSDTENEGKSKHGRKNIRRVMGKNQLEEATKKAAREEKERLARIAERQKMYNNLQFDESGKPDEVILDKVVLDFDPDTKEPLIELDRGLVKKLKPHQANGIKFMWDACFESVKRIKKDRGSGCILAHCMGLGKTLQVVSLTHTLLIHSDKTKVNRVLVVCPLSTVLNWVNEFKIWLKHADTDYEVDVYELSRFKQNSERAYQLSSWFEHGGVCVLGYEMFRNLSADNPKKFKKKMLKQFQESLVDPGPDLVVCDEGHLLKNEKTSLSQSMNRVRTRRRIVLTGTPLQNNLKEYYCMVQFVKPNLLGKYNEYLNRFVNPITNGQYTDSTEYDIKIMKRRSHVLHKMLDGAVQRRDYGVLAPFLPPKHEYVLFITLTDVQVKLYQHYLENYSRRPLAGKSSGFLFPDFQSLQRIWTHPLVLKYNSERYEIMQQKKREREEEEDSEGSLADFIDDDSTPDETSSEEESDSLSDASDDSQKKSKKKKSSKKSKTKEGKASTRRGTRANPADLDPLVEPDPDPDVLEVKSDNPTEWWIPLVTDDEIEDMRNSHKLVLLFEILRQCEAIGDKLLVFSQSLYSLDLIEHFLGKVDEATQEGRIDEKLGGHVGSWSPGIDYFRLDGSTSCENRSIWCKNFNREDNPRARLFLISTRAGGLGINLVAANRVVIFDVSWNPSHDVQSIFRVYRFGQKKPCYIYRFLAMGTMEEKIYERQVTKQAISKRVIDEQQIDRHYAENDLAELYKFEPRPAEPRPVPLVPKDRLFAEMLKEREHVIYKFHEHDSLLENKEEETLSEEERKAAWEDFENEKNRPPPQPFSAWPMHNGMPGLPNLLAQQQQQLAYAALAQMLRKDMPGLTDDNIRSMLPLIYSSNPTMFGGYDYGLMQKLSSLYAQPGLMNPAMMNPGMNVGGAQAGMGGGGTSGLQYEPPWQRQQQQQQQMRLQQMMQQQQNQMGAKFYAGGLGSRDPVAMALQQQRAREIMLGGGGGGGAAAGAGGGAGRPRGRPPLSPRAPPAAHTGDVVNLDSD